MWVAATNAGASLGAWVVSQTPDPGQLDFRQLGIAAIVCAVLLAGWWIEHKRASGLETECSRLQHEAVERERELGNTIVPLLTRTTDLLVRFSTLATEIPHPNAEAELTAAVQQLTDVVGKLNKND